MKWEIVLGVFLATFCASLALHLIVEVCSGG